MYRTNETIEQILDTPSLYPDRERKSRERREKDLTEWAEKYNENCEYYNLYGMDLADAAPCDEWLDYGVFRKQRFDANSRYFPHGSEFPYNYILFMRDKMSFEMFTRSVLGTKSKAYVPSIGCLLGSKVYRRTEDGALIPENGLEDFTKEHEGGRLVFKEAFGCSGESVYIVRIENGSFIYSQKKAETLDSLYYEETVYAPAEFLAKIANPSATWLIQEYIEQSDELNRINPSCVNTMRILTFHTGERIVVPDLSILRFGKNGALLDNADSGGLAAGVTGEGELRSQAFGFVKMSVEPNPFAGIRITQYKEAVELVRTLHSFLPQLFTVGWDIAFTKNGPAVVEGNDGWDPSLNQPPKGNQMRRLWDELLAERKQICRN